jgi:tripartite-type tricarboxylate transporter receptor subunit TctC
MKAILVAAFSTAIAFATAAHAQQDYPNRPIRIIQGFAPGGNADAIARVLAAELTKSLGQPVLVESKPGAGGTLGADSVAKAAPDGYTLGLLTGGHPVGGALYKSVPYKTVDDFEWISTAALLTFVVSVNANSKTPSLKSLLDAARASPYNVKYGSAGIGSTQHLVAELLASEGHVQMTHVPYRGESAAITAALSDEVNFIVTTLTPVVSQIQAGTLKAIAVSTAMRSPDLPDVPTAAEAALPGFEVSSWAGLATTGGTPRPIVQKLNREVLKALQVPEVKSRIESFGAVVQGSTPEEMRARVARDLARWTQVIDKAKIERQ